MANELNQYSSDVISHFGTRRLNKLKLWFHKLENYRTVYHRRSQDFWLGGAQTLKNSAVFTEIESEFWAEIGNSNDFSAQNQVISEKKKKKKRSSPKLRVVFRPKPLALLFNYCYVRNYWKKTATKHRQAMLS